MIYDDPIGEEDDVITLMFPGDVSGSSPKRVIPERVGTRTLVFDTPGKYFNPILTIFFQYVLSILRESLAFFPGYLSQLLMNWERRPGDEGIFSLKFGTK